MPWNAWRRCSIRPRRSRHDYAARGARSAQIVRRGRGGGGRRFRTEGGRIAGADRPERRRQEHLLQHAERPAPAGRRLHRTRRQVDRRTAATRDLAARRWPHFPDHRHVPVDDRAGERADGAAVVSPPAALATALVEYALRRRGVRLSRVGRHGGSGGTPVRRAGVRRSEAGRAGNRARQSAEAAADGRADGRDGARRAHRGDAACRRDRAASGPSACCLPSTTWTWCSRTPRG